jgi:PAS domain S-box-containing protein
MKRTQNNNSTYDINQLILNQHKTIFSNISSAVVAMTVDGEIQYVNNYIERISKYRVNELIGISFFTIVAPESKKLVSEAFHALAQGKSIKPYEIALVDKNGQKIYVKASALPITHRKKAVGIIGFAADISEHKKNVEYLSKTVKELSLLYDIGKELTSTVEIDIVFSKILMYLSETLGYERAGILLLDEHTKTLEVKATTKPFTKSKRQVKVKPGKGITGLVARTGKPYIVKDVKKEHRYVPLDKNTKSEVTVPLKVGNKIIGVINVESYKRDTFDEDDVRLLTLIANQAAIAIDNSNLYSSLEDSYLDTIRALVSAMEAKDHYTRGHSERVRQYALAIAEELDLDDKMKKELNYAGFLHDIGKIGISDYLLGKIEPLTINEYNIIKRHPEIGHFILKEVKHLSNTCEIIKSEHERYDGKGYPNGIKAKKIHIGARIIAVADAYDAMTTDRPYRKAISSNKAIQQLKHNAGKQFDPKVVKAFLKVIKKKRS